MPPSTSGAHPLAERCCSCTTSRLSSRRSRCFTSTMAAQMSRQHPVRKLHTPMTMISTIFFSILTSGPKNTGSMARLIRKNPVAILIMAATTSILLFSNVMALTIPHPFGNCKQKLLLLPQFRLISRKTPASDEPPLSRLRQRHAVMTITLARNGSLLKLGVNSGHNETMVGCHYQLLNSLLTLVCYT